MKLELKCLNCNVIFEVEYKHKQRKYCCQQCYIEYKKNNTSRKINPSLREKRVCIICDSEFEVKKTHNKKMCSEQCRKIWNSQPQNKQIRINKSKEILLQKYGVDSLFKKQEYKDNYKNLITKKYGVDHPMKIKEVVIKLQESLKQKQINNLLPKLKLNNLLLLDEYTINKKEIPYNFKCLKCNNIFSSTLLGCGRIPICRKCFPLTKNSKIEESLRDFLNKHNIKHSDNNRKILNGKEIDLLLESYDLGIEVDGLYYHSEIGGEKNKKYHLNKTLLAKEKNIKLIHIFEDEILYKNEMVQAKLLNLLGLTPNKIFARKCIIKEVSNKKSQGFLTKNHIQGNLNSKIKLGLYYENKLVSLLNLSSTPKQDYYEITRFCNKLNTIITDSFSKLLKYFIKNYNPKQIITYADIRWSGIDEKETLYYKNNFNYIGNTPPNYWYVKTGEYNNRYHRFNFRKDKLIKQGFDPKLTKFEIMQLKGYDRIWDCGNMKFELSLL